MTSRERLLTILLGITGIIAAGAIALAANAISGREIGLSAEPVSLVAKTPQPRPAPVVKEDRRESEPGDENGGTVASSDDFGSGPGPSSSSGPGPGGGDERRGAGGGPGPSAPAPTAPAPGPGGDDVAPAGGGLTTTTSNSGPGSDSSGDGGGHSGPG